MSRKGLFPMPIETICCTRSSREQRPCYQPPFALLCSSLSPVMVDSSLLLANSYSSLLFLWCLLSLFRVTVPARMEMVVLNFLLKNLSLFSCSFILPLDHSSCSTFLRILTFFLLSWVLRAKLTFLHSFRVYQCFHIYHLI